MSSEASSSTSKRAATFEDALELFRQCKNIVQDGFSGKYVSALRSFCDQRQFLVEERRRLVSSNYIVEGEGSLRPPFHGGVGVLALFHNHRSVDGAGVAPSTVPTSYPLVDGIIGQLECDIADIVTQLHTSTTQVTAAHKRLSEVAMQLLTQSIAGNAPALAQNGGGGYAAREVAAAALSMAHVCAEVRVWSMRALTDVRGRLVDPCYDGVDAVIAGLSWWDGERPQPIDAEKAWRAASDTFLNDAAKILILASER